MEFKVGDRVRAREPICWGGEVVTVGSKSSENMVYAEEYGTWLSPEDVELVESVDAPTKNLRDVFVWYKGGTIKSDGGPASYYDFPECWKTLNDYIEYKSEHQWGADSFHLANITKAGCRWGDKDGTSKPYDAKKIVYSALRILRRLCGVGEVRKFLLELLEDPQFK